MLESKYTCNSTNLTLFAQHVFQDAKQFHSFLWCQIRRLRIESYASRANHSQSLCTFADVMLAHCFRGGNEDFHASLSLRFLFSCFVTAFEEEFLIHQNYVID
jgi:hypothetical protein